MNVILAHVWYLNEESFPEQGLSSLNLVYWVFFHNSSEFRVRGSYFSHLLLILFLCYPKYHVEALFGVDPIRDENLPKFICPKSWWLVDEIHPLNMNFFEKGDEILLYIVEYRTLWIFALNINFRLFLSFFFLRKWWQWMFLGQK